MRTYDDLCGIARALDVVGERWALLVIRELMLGPKRFTDLRAGLPGAGPDMLAARLRDLEAAGVVQRRTLEPPANARVYELTERGQALRPVLLELGRWGNALPPRPDAAFGPDSGALALVTLFDPERDPQFDATLALRLDDQSFTVRVSRGEIDVARGAPAAPAATIATSPRGLAAVLWEGRELEASERDGELEIDGDRGAVERFLELFPLPG